MAVSLEAGDAATRSSRIRRFGVKITVLEGWKGTKPAANGDESRGEGRREEEESTETIGAKIHPAEVELRNSTGSANNSQEEAVPGRDKAEDVDGRKKRKRKLWAESLRR